MTYLLEATSGGLGNYATGGRSQDAASVLPHRISNFIAIIIIKGESMSKKIVAEFIGTFWLVLGGCGSAVLAAAFPDVGIGLLGVSLAFGLTVLTMAFAIGHISGCHLNPAVSIGLWAGGRFSAKDLVPYIVAQVVARLSQVVCSISLPVVRRAFPCRWLCFQRLW
ncbi:MAG: aquaporin [Caldilineaceae bacterium]